LLFRKSKGLLCDWAFRELRWGGKIEDWKFKGQDRRGNSVTRTLWDLFCRSNWYIYILLLLLLFNYSWVGPSSLKKETLLKLWVFPVQALQIQYEFFFFSWTWLWNKWVIYYIIACTKGKINFFYGCKKNIKVLLMCLLAKQKKLYKNLPDVI
jgi:hypothetical protein